MTSAVVASEGHRTPWAAGRPTLLLLIPASCYYAFLLSAGAAGLFDPLPHGLTFNSMLLHLLQGRFDVDPAAIGDEGYLRGGATYAYFGIFPALFRGMFLWLPDFARTDFTRLGCLVAVSLMALFKVFAARAVWRRWGAPRSAIVLSLLTAAILGGGPQIEFLRPTIFQEAALWAAACAAAFVFLAVRGWIEGFTPRLLAWLALAAGLCLLARVSTALGLYLALGGIWLVLCRRQWRAAAGSWRRLAALSWPLLIAAGFVVATGIVNYGRWGNPLVFADLTQAIIAQRYPERLARVREYGEFNLLRLPYSLAYYFLPLWVLRDGAGDLWWSAFQQRLIDSAELPPASFLVSDPLLLGLAAFGFLRLRRLPGRGALIAAAGGFVVPILLMLTAISMTFRYRLEFYPLIELGAFVGFAALLANPAPPRRLLLGATAASVVIAHAFWLLYMISPLGPAAEAIGSLGVLDFYGALVH